MTVHTPFRTAAAAGALFLALASPALVFAHEHGQGEGHGHHGMWQRDMKPEERAQWLRQHLDKEAQMLEIKASQQGAWEAYAGAVQDMMAGFAARKPLPADADAATTMRQHADQAAAMAQGLAKVADATDKLQAVLDENQRKVFSRLVRMHARFHGEHHGEGMEGHEHRQGMMHGGPAKAAPKAAPAARPAN